MGSLGKRAPILAQVALGAALVPLGCASLSGLSSGSDDAGQDSTAEGASPTSTDSGPGDAPRGPPTDGAAHSDSTTREDSASGEDGASREDGATPMDATKDSGLIADSASPVEAAGPEAAVEAGPTSWCTLNAPDASFCDDFDDHPFGYGWTTFSSHGIFDGGLDPSVFQSPPYGLTVFVQPSDAGAAYDYLERSYPSAYETLKLSFHVRFDNSFGTADVAFAAIQFGGGTSTPVYYAQLVFGMQGVYLVQRVPTDGGASYPQTAAFVLPQLGQWIRLTIMISSMSDGGAPSLSVSQDSTVLLPSQLIGTPAASGPPLFLVGQLFDSAGEPATKVHLDNVVIEVE